MSGKITRSYVLPGNLIQFLAAQEISLTCKAIKNTTMNEYGTPPKNYLVESILVTIFCCLPFGIVGIINAANVNSKWAAGDLEGAERASAEAKKWTKVGFICGIVVVVLYVILILTTSIGAIFWGSQFE
jgi:hypothetical protein